jgi:ABC-2 type transport system ATP-binding protein
MSCAEDDDAVRTTALTRRFARRVAVAQVSLAVRRGLIYGLLGANGAGKTTLIKMLTTLLPASAGSARVAGEDIGRSPGRVRSRIGYVPQLLSADGALTAHENLWLSAMLHGLPGKQRRERIAQALVFAGLADAAHRLVRTYSGGMVRRLELAQAMLHEPLVLFLDEPTIGLDPVARHSVWERLRQLQRERGLTVVMSTHDMEEAQHLCDELSILQAGRVVVSGTPAALCASLGENADLEAVFAHYAGGADGGMGAVQGQGPSERFGSAMQTRATARRLG